MGGPGEPVRVGRMSTPAPTLLPALSSFLGASSKSSQPESNSGCRPGFSPAGGVGWGRSQGFSAPEAAGPPPLADPRRRQGGSWVPGGPSSILVCQRRRNSQTCRQPSPLRGEQPNVAHTPRNIQLQRKAVPTRLRHGRFTVMLSLKEARHKRAEAIQFRFRGAQGVSSERQKVGGGGCGVMERGRRSA